MAITVSGGAPRFSDDQTSAQITQIYHNKDGVYVLVGPSSYLIAGTSATLSSLRASNPTFRVTTLTGFLHELLSSTDLTSDRLANAVHGNQGR